MGLEFLIFPWLLSWMGVGFCQMLSQHLRRWSCYFCFWVCLYSGLCWWISYIKPSLHPWDEAYLVMMDDHFNVFLDSVCKDFIEYLCIVIHKGNWSEVLFLCLIFVQGHRNGSIRFLAFTLILATYWCRLLLSCLGMGLEFLIFPRLLSWMGVGSCQMLFLHLTRWSCGFCLWVCLYNGLHWWISVY